MYDQRDIVLIPFPYSDLTGSKQRPALILSNKNIIKNDKICCLITTKPQHEDISINKEDFESETLPFKSFVRPYRIFTIEEKIIIKKLCTIKKEFHDRVIKKVNNYIKKE